jgi:serine/threonine protein kinase
MVELCGILGLPYETFSDISDARKMVRQEFAAKDQPPSSRKSSITSVLSPSTVSSVGLRDWRSHALFDSRKKRKFSTNSSSIDWVVEDTRMTCVVLLAAQVWLRLPSKTLPPEWCQSQDKNCDQDIPSVVLVSDADDFEEVGKFMLASGEVEIRDRLHGFGISDHLLHPLSLIGVKAVVQEACRRRNGEDFLLTQHIGRGSSGIVHLAKRLRDGKAFALKEICTKGFTKRARQGIELEVELLRTLKWPTVLFIIDAWIKTDAHIQYMLMPLLKSSLEKHIESARLAQAGCENGQHIRADQAAEWYAQALHGLCYLHWQGILHRDVKPGNLLTGDDIRALQIADLGSAAKLPGPGPHPKSRAWVKGKVGTPSYMAPETVMADACLAASDMWSLGVSFYEILTLRRLLDCPCEGRASDSSQSALEMTDHRAKLTSMNSEAEIFAALPGRHSNILSNEDLVAVLRCEPLERPAASQLASRPAVTDCLRAVLVGVGAIPEAAQDDHLSEFRHIASESRSALSGEPEGRSFIELELHT